MSESLPITKVREDLYRLLGMEEPINAPAFVADVVANAINAAIQDIFRETGEYFRYTQTHSLTYGGSGRDTSKAELPIEPSTNIIRVRVGGRNLRPLARRQEVDYYAATYNPSAASGTPEAYFLERTYDGEAGAILHITPPALAGVALVASVDTTFEVPHISAADLTNASISLPVPLSWVETYLMPLSRGHAMRSHYWIMKDEAAMYSADYEKAIANLKLLNPKPKADNDTRPQPEQGRGE